MPHRVKLPNRHSLVEGYDARENFLASDAIWTNERRQIYLLKTDVLKPLSTDVLVWPSIFDSGQGVGMPEAQRRSFGFDGVQLPDWIGHKRPLWESLDQLLAYVKELDQGGHPVRRFWIVAITLESVDDLQPATEYPLRLARAHFPDRSQFLGYDVADSSLSSGLSGCGYSALEVATLRRTWVSHVNQYHLFDNIDSARLFTSFTNTRIPDQAPFYVFGLWRVITEN